MESFVVRHFHDVLPTPEDVVDSQLLLFSQTRIEKAQQLTLPTRRSDLLMQEEGLESVALWPTFEEELRSRVWLRIRHCSATCTSILLQPNSH
ncbi:hypothetical protein RvY_17038 [Ramazzottius varieornatus]|uniref:Uncharacterized protein n=1 Tax=Ramazzottius varieornatus TaxID=947166 RepID=A0A1D1W347_RAMVA|nr:hypothetical protein RvY_17038 [Ramazzottius varieornatus]